MAKWREDLERYKARADTFAAIMRLKQDHRGKPWDSESVETLSGLLDQYEALGGIVQRGAETFPFKLNSPSLWVLQSE